MVSTSDRAVVLFLALAVLYQAVPGYGFLIQTYENRRTTYQVKWANSRAIPVMLYEGGSSDLPDETVFRVLREGLQVWESVPSAVAAFNDMGVTSTLPNPRDSINVMAFDPDNRWLDLPPGSGVIAATLMQTDSFTRTVTDADIVFNDSGWRFVTGDDSGSRSVNLKDVVVHEVGHLLGLDHTPLVGPPAVRPTMNPFYGNDGPGETSTLEPDDVAGVSLLYPTVGFQFDTGGITGKVTNEDGENIFGVHVIAEELLTGARISTMTGAFPGAGRGEYRLQGLPAGSYRIGIEAVQEPISEDNFGGIFRSLAGGFTAEFFDNTADPELARPIQLDPGGGVESIDFATGLLPDPVLLDFLLAQGNTPDAVGPYTVQVRAENVTEVLLTYRIDDGKERVVRMELVSPGIFEAQIPGQSVGTRVEYQITGLGDMGARANFPPIWEGFNIIELTGSPAAYVALREENALSIVDTETSEELARIRMGSEPIQLILHPSGNRLYVSNIGSDEIVVVETSTFQIIERIPVGSQPLDMTLSPDGNTLYVGNSGAGSITAIDLESHQPRLMVDALGSDPFGLAATEDHVYVADIDNDQLLVLDVSGTIIERLAMPAGPRSLALNSDRTRLYVTSFRSGRMAVLNTADNALINTFELPISGSFAVAAGRDGMVFVTAHEDGLVLIVDGEGGAVLNTIQVGADPRGVSIAPSGDQVFVTNAQSNEIVVFDPVGGEILATFSTGANPRGVAVGTPPAVDVTAVETMVELARSAPKEFVIEPNFPNPFNASTVIAFQVIGAGQTGRMVDLSVFNAVGHRIRTLVHRVHVAGSYRSDWDGRDGSGNQVASGVYIISLRSDNLIKTRRVLLLR